MSSEKCSPKPHTPTTEETVEFRSERSAAVILAAGCSSRMGRPKAFLYFRGATFLERILELYRTHGIPACVVLGGDQHEVESRLDLRGSKTVFNPAPECGPLSSLHIALSLIEKTPALFLHAVDHPLVSHDTVTALVQAQHLHPSAILIPSFRSRSGHPVVFPRCFYPDLQRAPLEIGARWVVRQHSDAVVHVRVEDRGILANLNNPEDLKRWGVE
jgi:CTP:molybdopterin cytidylyltransferase MocA